MKIMKSLFQSNYIIQIVYSEGSSAAWGLDTVIAVSLAT